MSRFPSFVYLFLTLVFSKAYIVPHFKILNDSEECTINEDDCSDYELRYSLLNDLIPVVLLILSGASLLASFIFGLRLGSAKKIKKEGVVHNKDLLNRIKIHRVKLAKVKHLPVVLPLPLNGKSQPNSGSGSIRRVAEEATTMKRDEQIKWGEDSNMAAGEMTVAPTSI